MSLPCPLLLLLQSWLLPHRMEDQRYWQYGYELRFTNSSEEPLQLLNKTWQVTELSGMRSVGLTAWAGMAFPAAAEYGMPAPQVCHYCLLVARSRKQQLA